MTDRLRECPFCGGEVYVSREDCYGNIDDNYLVHCDECGLQFGFINQFESEEEAIKAWNTRKPMDRIVEQLEEEVKWAETHGTDKKFRHGRISGLLTAQRLVKGGAE